MGNIADPHPGRASSVNAERDEIVFFVDAKE
jgi:hypothetical protein